ncbi:TonB-dependent receptor [Flavivirga algicola]|uniref:TonB-dependent receptor n=1 Tax=Flavivirga algicola TaxID=2729136 RepID=A0ABX1RTK3_9FLAO|nr:TonB-dependent receptor [Flavivirga algicola]NMH86876.1 TonB-dependent receptor [Flavivirga algicola]
MKLTVFLFLVSIFSINANTYSQNTKITCNLENVKITRVFEIIEKDTKFKFLYNHDEIDVNRVVSVKAEKIALKDVLNNLFANTNISFKVRKKQIILKKSEAKPLNILDKALNIQDEIEKIQNIKITGVVTGDDGLPLIGANVIVKGTSIGAVTDFDGNYQLNDVPPTAETLVFSYLGFKTKEVAINGQTVINTILESDASALDEVVVIGYGTTTKRKMVGAISSLDTEALEETPFANVSQALQGQVSGLMVQNSGGGLDKAPNISIRGAGKPLFIIDGVIIDPEDDFSFTSLNADDIESMSFLKDASATAVYGSRAGNGIVLVKTKRGKEGKLKVNYSYNYQLSQPTVLPERNSTYEYALIQNAAAAMDGIAPFFTDSEIEGMRLGTNRDLFPDSDWVALSLKDFASESRHNISASGGSKSTNYFVSMGYFDQGGILKSDAIGLDRLNIRSNLTTRFDEIGLEIGFNVNSSLQNYRAPALGEYTIWNNMFRKDPLLAAFNEDGTFGEGVNHPLAQNSKDAGYLKQREKFVNTQLILNWKVPGIEGLSAGAMVNYRDGDSYEKKWEVLAPQFNSDGSVYPVSKPRLDIESGFTKKTDIEANINYAKTFGVHGLDVTFAYNRIEAEGEGVSASRREFPSRAIDQIFAGPSDGQLTDGYAWQSANEGYVGRFKYDYASKYILEFSFRYDGNDNFAKDQRWGLFPATSFAWIASDEGFMKPLKDKGIINYLKLRASYGETGLSDGAIRLGYIPSYNLNPNAYNIGNVLVNGFSEGPLVNPNALTWFTRTSLNLGFDFNALKNKLSGSFDYFYYETDGFLQSPLDQYITPLGKDLPQIKSNSIQRRAGFELGLRYKNKVNDFSYEIGANYSRFDQLWERLDTEDEVTLKNPYIRVTHETNFFQRTPNSTAGLLVSNGLFQNGQDILNAPRPVASVETQPGDVRYVDVNGDGKIDVEDQRRFGKPTFPSSIYGIDFKLGYKAWSLMGLIQGTGDRYVAMGNGYQNGQARTHTLTFQQDYWSPTNTNAFFPRVSHTAGYNGGNNQLQSDYFVLNAKYIRLKTLQLGYDLKSTLFKNQDYISGCKLFLSGVNLFTISDVLDYFDPEDVVNQDNSVNGYTGAAYPLQRTYSLGVNVQF